MNETIREQLSAMADGELGGEGGRFLLKRLDHDLEVRSVWERYHLIRDCLRERSMRLAPSDFCARVATAIADDHPTAGPVSAVTGTASTPTVRRSGWHAAMGLAVAASVSALALLGVRGNVEPSAALPSQASVSQLAPLTTSDLVPAWRIPGVAETQRYLLIPTPPTNDLDAYFVRHGEASGQLGPLGLVPSVRAVAATDTAQVGNRSGKE